MQVTQQLGAVISRETASLLLLTRATTERELLSIVETLKEFRNILLGYKVIVYTDHKNLCCKNFNTEAYAMEIDLEYNPELKYIKEKRTSLQTRFNVIRRFHSSSFVHEANAMAECFNNDGLEFPSQHYPLHMSTISH
jgi:hypothetical protein